MQRQQNAGACEFGEFFGGKLLQLFFDIQNDEKDEAGNQHPPPYQKHFVQCDEFAEYAGKSGKENGEVQFYEVLFHVLW